MAVTSNTFGSSPKGKRKQTIKAYVVSSHVSIPIQRQKSRFYNRDRGEYAEVCMLFHFLCSL